MRGFYKRSLYKIFVSLFIIFYSFVPPALAIDEFIDSIPQEGTETVDIVEEGEESPPIVSEKTEETPIIIIEESEVIEEMVLEDSQAVEEQPPLLETEVVEVNSCLENLLNPTIETNKDDYYPTEVVVLSGSGFLPITQYLFVLYSNNIPETYFETEIFTDENGSFEYSYQLDGVFRPLYFIEIYNLEGNLISTYSFTDSEPIRVYECVNDLQGANDEPGQKDLNQMCIDDSEETSGSKLYVTWNWDDTAWSGTNTGDACSLFDTDGDGYANYSLCVVVDGDPASYKTTALYSCGDASSNKCTNPITLMGIVGSTVCSAQVKDNTDPFSGPATKDKGNNYPYDTVAMCTIDLADIGSGLNAELIDVCSYPSNQPNSDPSDCIKYAPRMGKLEIVKEIVPTTDTGLFNLLIEGEVSVENVGNGGTTGERSLRIGTYIVSETAGTGTSLSNYNSSIECKNLNGTGSIVASSQTTSVSVTVGEDDDIICRIINTRNTGTLTVNKVTYPSGDLAEFSITASSSDGGIISGSSNGVVTDANDYIYTVSVGTYSVAETVPTGWHLDSNSCTNIYIGPGANESCTITNTKYGSISGYKLNDLDGEASTTNDRIAIEGWTIELYKHISGDTYEKVDETETDSLGKFFFEGLLPGQYQLREVLQIGWIQLSGLTIDVTLTAGEEDINNNFINIKLGEIQICKYEDINGDGNKDSGDFGLKDIPLILSKYIGETWVPQSTVETGENGCYTFLRLYPGTYRVTEDYTQAILQDYYPSNGVAYKDFTISGNQASWDFFNAKYRTISGQKYEDLNGNGIKDGGEPGLSGWTIYMDENFNGVYNVGEAIRTTDSSGYYEFSHLVSDSYKIGEVLQANWTQTAPTLGYHNVDVHDAYTATNIDFGNFAYVTINVTKNVVNPDDVDIADTHEFTATLNGGNSKVIAEGTTASYTVTNSGPYTISEVADQNYDFLGCELPTIGVATGFYVQSGATYSAVCTNRQKKATLILEKTVINDDGGQKTAEDFNVYTDKESVKWGTNSLNPDTYLLSEEEIKGYTASLWGGDCTSDGSVTLTPGQTKTCTITNDDQPGTIIIMKDVLGIEGEDIYSNDSFEVELEDKLLASQYIRDSEENPLYATFGLLSAGYYSPTEVDIPDGYQFNGCYPLVPTQDTLSRLVENHNGGTFLGNGETLTFICENQVIQPILEITKLNDKGLLGIYVGDIVTYTIKVKAPFDEIDGTYYIKDVTVIDILPEGFEYISGSWTGTTSEPVYKSPGEWYLGHMKEGDERTLTYRAVVSSTQDAGLYKDIVYTYGTSILSSEDGDVLGLGIGSGDPSTNLITTHFVGTQVLVIEDPELEEGEVLGALIELPATGAETYITLGAIISMILGFILLVFNPKGKMRNLFITGVLLLGIFTVVKPTEIYAIVPKVEVQIEQPASPTKKDVFKIAFVASDTGRRDIKVQCYVNGVSFGPEYLANSGNCEVTPSIITASGTYEFYVKVTADSDVKTSESVFVEVKLEKPLPVVNYSKTEGTCSYTLTFKTSNDGRTSKVQIFRSSTQPFTANASTMIDQISVSPNESVTYVDNPVPNCSTEYFYAVRALDSIGNASTFTTDNIVKIVYTYTPSTETEGTTDGTGEVAGEEINIDEDGTGGNGEEEEEGDDNGEVKGEEDEESVENEKDSFWNKYRYVLLAIGVAVLGGIGYIYVRRKK